MAEVDGVFVAGGFDDLRSSHVRFLEEAARLGSIHLLLWSDNAVRSIEGREPKFPQGERQYLLEAIRYVDRVILCDDSVPRDALPLTEAAAPATWVVDEDSDNAAKRAFCRSRGMKYRVLTRDELHGFSDVQQDVAEKGTVPDQPLVGARRNGPEGATHKWGLSPFPLPFPLPSERTRVVVTGCYDWFHSGHVRFFEEVSHFGDLYVVLGHDANVRFLKGEGHPLFPEQERRYLVQSVRYVKQALIATGWGWLDAEPQLQLIQPHIYAVNEDGDRPEKSAYCAQHGIEYRVLKRLPKEGLPQRQSTSLRGF